MSSILAIVSKSVFEAIAPSGVAEGSTLPLDRYTSNNKALNELAGGGDLFLVTVRPPNEALWLVAVLEQPTAKAGAWVADKNQAPITRINDLLPKLRLKNGKGIVAKPGALGMTLQTPRALTDEDVLLLRAAARRSGSGKEATLVRDMGDVVVEAKRDARPAERSRTSARGQRLELRHQRRLFSIDEKDWPPHTEQQLAALLSGKAKERAEICSQARAGGAWSELEVLNVVDLSLGETVFQLYLWGSGSGAMFRHGSVEPVAYVCQHGMEVVSEEVDPEELLAALRDACAKFPGKLGQFIDFESNAAEDEGDDEDEDEGDDEGDDDDAKEDATEQQAPPSKKRLPVTPAPKPTGSARDLDWKSLRTPKGGPATRVPSSIKQLAAARDEDDRYDSLTQFHGIAVAGGSWSNASAPALTLLFDHVGKAPQPEHCLWAAADVLAGGCFEAWVAGRRLVHPQGEARACARVLEGHLDMVLACLAAERSDVRAAAATLLGVAAWLAPQTLPRLEAQLKHETQPACRASLLCALEWLDEKGRWKGELARIAQEDGPSAYPRGLAALACLRDPDRRLADCLPGLAVWVGGALAEVRYCGFTRLSNHREPTEIVSELLAPRGEEGKAELIEALVKVGARVKNVREVGGLTNLLDEALEHPCEGDQATIVPAQQLPPHLRKVALGLADSLLYPEPRWMPQPGRSRRRWLGLETPGVLERQGTWTLEKGATPQPMWQILQTWGEDVSEGEIFPPELRKSLSVEEQWLAAIELPAYGYPHWVDEKVATRLGSKITIDDRLGRIVEETLREELTLAGVAGGEATEEGAKNLETSLESSRLLLLPWVRSGRPFPETFYPLFLLRDDPEEREVMAAVPKEVVGDRIRRRLEPAIPRTANGLAKTMLAIIDVAPTPAACDELVRVVESVVLQAKEPDEETTKLYAKMLKKIPELARARARLQATKGAEEKPRRKR